MPFALAMGAVPQVSVEDLFGTNYVRAAQLSPDGTKVAFLAPSGDTYGLVLLDLATHAVTNPVHIVDENIRSFFWKGRSHIIFTGLIGGNEVPQVACTDVEGKKVFSILKAQTTKLDFSIYSGDLLSTRREDPGHIYVEGYTTDSNFGNAEHSTPMGELEPLILKVDILNGERTEICPADNGEKIGVTVGDFGIDHAGRVRTGFRSKGDTSTFLYRDDSSDVWKSIRTFPAEQNGWDVLGFTGDDRGVYILDRETSDTGALRVYDPDTNTLGPVLYEVPDGEIDSLIFSPDGKRLIGLRYETEKIHFHWFEAKYANLQAKLDRSFDGLEVAFASISDDENRILIRTYSDRDRGAYYLLDVAKGSLGLVTVVGPKIKASQMAPMQPVTYASRDGLSIHGYLTLPLDRAPGSPVPFIIHPHGGPFGIRDSWGFDPEVQFLANRGYGVLQINYRGSGGYGSKFLHAGYQQWGGKMQDDLTDGVKWAVAQGYADPKRTAIYGASYGGYATLAGLVFTPELYKCGINYVGVSDLVELARRKYESDSDARASFFHDAVGPDHDALYNHSPVNFVERIRVPLLNAYGENDPRVDVAQWTELKAQLDKYHKDYEYIFEKDEGHGFSHQADAFEFYTKVDAFLKKNL